MFLFIQSLICRVPQPCAKKSSQNTEDQMYRGPRDHPIVCHARMPRGAVTHDALTSTRHDGSTWRDLSVYKSSESHYGYTLLSEEASKWVSIHCVSYIGCVTVRACWSCLYKLLAYVYELAYRSITESQVGDHTTDYSAKNNLYI